MRAGKLLSGEEQVLRAIRRNQVHLVVLADDAAFNTRKRIIDKCRYYDVSLVIREDRYTLGQCIGKEERVVLAVTDGSLAALLLQVSEEHPGGDVDE